MDDQPVTRYTTLGKDRIAYQVFGAGPPDLVYLSAMGEVGDARWEWPPYAGFLRRLGAFSRVIMFDRRGMGASDAVSQEGVPTWEAWADDIRAVLRHTMATLMLASGEHPKVVSERLGHATVGITLDTYSHVLPGLQEAAADRLEATVLAARPKAQ